MLKIQSWECICCSPGMCVFTPWWSLTLESCNDKSKLRGHLPYSGPSSEVSTPSSLYMEYGKWVLGRLGLQLCLCSPLVPAKLWAAWLSSQLCGGYIPYSLTLPSFSTPVLEIILPAIFLLLSDLGVPPSLMLWVLSPWMLSLVEWLSEWVRGTLERGLWVSGLN